MYSDDKKNTNHISDSSKMLTRRLRTRFWKYQEEIPPNYVRYQRIPASFSGGKMSFNVKNIIPNSLMLANGKIKWSFAVNKQKNVPAAAVPENFTLNDRILVKPNILENCIKNMNVSINGYNIGTYQEMRYWAKLLTRSFKSDNLLFSTDGGEDPDYAGLYDERGYPTFSDPTTAGISDDNVQLSLNTAWTSVAAANGTPTATFNLLSLINVAVFNKYWGSNKYNTVGWAKKMSDATPYVKNLDFNFDLDKIETNALYYMHGITSGAGFEAPQLVNGRITSAELILEWIDTPTEIVIPKIEMGLPTIHETPFGNKLIRNPDYFGDSADIMTIPDEVKMQSYTVNFHKFDLGVVNNTALYEIGITQDANGRTLSPKIELYQVPDYILLFATVDKDSANYVNIANQYDDGAGTNFATSANLNANESNMNFESLTVTTNVSTQIINTQWNDRELYNLTASNCKKNYPFSSFLGGFKQNGDYLSNFYVLMRPADIGIKEPAGSFANRLTFEVSGSLRATDGNIGLVNVPGGDKPYVLCAVLIYSSFYIAMDKTGKVNTEYVGQFV